MSNDTLSKLNEVFQDTFEDDDLNVGIETTADQVEGWDSMMHVTLIVNVETAFGLRFKSSDIAELKSVGDLVTLVDRAQG